MKIEKNTKYKNKILKLKIIQTKIFNSKQYKNNIKLEETKIRLKKIFQIIYQYHIFNKKILFIGVQNNKNFKLKNLLKKTKHVLIPNSIWIRGAISNKKSCFKHISNNPKFVNNKISELLFKLKKNFDLIVVFDEINNFNIINESYIARIPVITLNSNLSLYNNKVSYKIFGNFQFLYKKKENNFFYLLLISVLKKGNKYKKKFKKSYNINIYNKKSFKYEKKYNKYYKKKKKQFKTYI